MLQFDGAFVIIVLEKEYLKRGMRIGISTSLFTLADVKIERCKQELEL
jgi:hypothetical protein